MNAYYLVGAAPPGTQRMVLQADAKDPVAQLIAQKNAFFDANLIPTNEDAFNLVTYWAVLGVAAGLGRSVDKGPAEDFFALRRQIVDAVSVAPDAPVDNPEQFWEILKQFAIDISSLSVVPTKWTLVKQSAREAVAELPGRIRDVAVDTGEVLGETASAVGKGLLGPVGITLLAAGALGFGYLALKKKG